jgi:hypothetical protein
MTRLPRPKRHIARYFSQRPERSTIANMDRLSPVGTHVVTAAHLVPDAALSAPCTHRLCQADCQEKESSINPPTRIRKGCPRAAYSDSKRIPHVRRRLVIARQTDCQTGENLGDALRERDIIERVDIVTL